MDHLPRDPARQGTPGGKILSPVFGLFPVVVGREGDDHQQAGIRHFRDVDVDKIPLVKAADQLVEILLQVLPGGMDRLDPVSQPGAPVLEVLENRVERLQPRGIAILDLLEFESENVLLA